MGISKEKCDVKLLKMRNMKDQPLILAVETSSRKGSVAVALGEKMLAEKAFSAPLRHSAEIFPAIRDLIHQFGMNPVEIEHVYISGGPGSFTGLRIATTIAKIMQLAHGVKIVTVDTLDVIAANVINLFPEKTLSESNHKQPAKGVERVAAILDAKRGQFFIAGYEPAKNQQPNGAGRVTWTKVLPDCLMTPSQFLESFARQARQVGLLGDGLLYYKEQFQADNIRFFDEKDWSPLAGKVLLLGRQMALQEQFTDALTLTPNYLRRPDVKIKSR